MNTISTNFRLSHKIQDEAFRLEEAGNCNLYITLSNSIIRLAVTDVERNKFVLLEDYELIAAYTPLQVAEQLGLIASSNPLFKGNRWHNLRVGISNQQFTLVPETLFDPDHQQDYLRLHSELNPQNELIHYYKHSNIEAVNIFALDKSIQREFNNIFPDQEIQFVHQTSALINGVMHQASRNEAKKLYIFVERNYVTLLVLNESGLQFCNIFHYISPEDFIYYVVFVMQEQKLNPEQETVYIWGDITHDSKLFNILQKYIHTIKFGRKPADVAYSYKFDDLFEHRYFEVYSLHLCE